MPFRGKTYHMTPWAALSGEHDRIIRYAIARRHRQTGRLLVDSDDLVQGCRMALASAMPKYRADRGAPSTFLQRCAYGSIVRQETRASVVRIPLDRGLAARASPGGHTEVSLDETWMVRANCPSPDIALDAGIACDRALARVSLLPRVRRLVYLWGLARIAGTAADDSCAAFARRIGVTPPRVEQIYNEFPLFLQRLRKELEHGY